MNSPVTSEVTSRPIVLRFVWSFVALTLVLVIGTIGYRIIGGPQYSWDRVRSGAALIVMATPEGRKAIEGLLGWV